jgi:hypothetical protein
MTKISQLADISTEGGLASSDEFIVRDVSSSGTPNKKVTASGFVNYVATQGAASGFSVIAAGVGPLSQVLTTSSGVTGTVLFSTALSTTLLERGRFTPSGQFLVGTTTAVAAGAKIQTVDGITFPATQVASTDPNTLDDYEEGTWTPTVLGSTTAGTATYSTQVGTYTRIGRKVTLLGTLGYSAGTGTGNLNIGGLPFVTANITSNFTIGSCLLANITTATGQTVTVQSANSSVVELQTFPPGGGTTSTTVYDAAGTIYFASNYFTT